MSTKNRSTEEEIMDNLSMEGEILQKTLDQIAAINKRLGGNKATINGLHTLMETKPRDTAYSIIDLGCGNGDMLRAVADYGRANKYIFRLTGIDANEFTVNYARKLSAGYPEISYIKMDILSDEFSALNFDIALATLFLHHFDNKVIEKLLTSLTKGAGVAVLINDLHRSGIAYYLFRLISLFISNPMVRNDGRISVLRGFKRKELIELSKKLQGTISSIQWKWAFRYQWIIKKT